MNKVPIRPNVIVQLFGEGETVSDQPRNPLSESIVQAFNVISLTWFFTNARDDVRGELLCCKLAKNMYKQRHIADKLLVRKPIIDGLIFEIYLPQNNQQFFLSYGQLLTKYKRRFSYYWQMTTTGHIQWSVYLVIWLKPLSGAQYEPAFD